MTDKTFTVEQVKYFMENPNEMTNFAEENDMITVWNHWLYESPGMTVSEIVEDFFYQRGLVEEETE